MKKILILLALMPFIGCYTEKQSMKQLNKAKKKYPVVVADFTRKAFPCLTKTDTVTKTETEYDFIEIQCPDQDHAIDTITDTIVINKNTHSKIYEPKTKTVIKVETETKYVTVRVKDSAEIYLAQKETKNCNEDKIRLEAKITRRNNIIISFLIAFIISLFFNILQYKSRK